MALSKFCVLLVILSTENALAEITLMTGMSKPEEKKTIIQLLTNMLVDRNSPVVAGPVNLALAITLGVTIRNGLAITGAMVVGLVLYGVTFALFIEGMRHVSTAQAGAYFSIAPFFGAVIAFVMGEPVSWPLGSAGSAEFQ